MHITTDLVKQFDHTDPKPDTWAALREWVDQQTGQTLEYFDLDMLTGWLWRRQGKESSRETLSCSRPPNPWWLEQGKKQS